MKFFCITTFGDAHISLRALLLQRNVAYTHLGDRYQAACQFLERNNLLSIIRAHEAQDAGCVRPQSTFPPLVILGTYFQVPDVSQDQDNWFPFSHDNLLRTKLPRRLQQQGCCSQIREQRDEHSPI